MVMGAIFGAIIGVVCAGGLMGLLFSPLAIPGMILATGIIAGPGAFIIGLPLMRGLKKEYDSGTPRRTVIRNGTLVGLPLGLLNMAFVLIIIGALSGGRMDGSILILLIPGALAGGAGLGLGTAFAATAEEKENT